QPLSFQLTPADKVVKQADGRSEYLAELAAEIAEMGKCQGCEMPEYVIHQEYEAGDMKSHLICSGCQKKCDEGIYKHENDYYSFRHPR
ncbi:5546_t:CDS:2, partial [Racocetra persica]